MFGKRIGFTIIELLVSLFIIGLLIALLLPAVQNARSSVRKISCLNRMRNVNLAMIQVVEQNGRFPACGNFTKEFGRHHSWVIDVLPWLEQGTFADKWNKDRSINDPENLPLTTQHFPILTCPADISVDGGKGDLSFVVNGGWGYTVYHKGVHDCPIDPQGRRLDLNGNGESCPPLGEADGKPSDKQLYFYTGLFFNETWKTEISERHHRPATVTDGMSNTLVMSENVRTGFNPDEKDDPWGSSWASPSPKLTSFHIGNPCEGAVCAPGKVDYNRSNSGQFRINSGLRSAEGTSPIPNSFHKGGVNMAFADGR
ncbi:MAG TPA: hypothetical protein DD473_15775, partial [Planctomycetaceae bacterium]|nr:hypothetical protein [Planctomycetaceae bacterium]